MKHAQRQAQKRRQAQAAAAVVGVDAGKFKHALSSAHAAGKTPRPFSSPPPARASRARGAHPRRHRGAAPEEVLVGIEFAGVYDFTLAHYLHQRGLRVVSILAAHTKKWKEVTHGVVLKSDPKDALTITDLLAQGQFVAFPFLSPSTPSGGPWSAPVTA